MRKVSLIFASFIVAVVMTAGVRPQSGGTFVIEKSAAAVSGGQKSRRLRQQYA